MKLNPGSKHLVSKFVSLFSKVSVLSTNHIKSAWEADLGTELSDEVWREGLEKIHLGSTNARLQLIQYKIMHRLHYSKVKLSKMYPDVSNICDRCNQGLGTLGHMFWLCPKIVSFWQQIFSWYSNVYDVQLDPDVVFILFGCSEAFFSLPRPMQVTIRFGTLVAKRLILNDWKATDPPSFSRWLREMVSGIHLEMLRCNPGTVIPPVETEGVWGPIAKHINTVL